MKKHAIIPIFIPHMGCPNDCVFCNQKAITAHQSPVSSNTVRETVEQWLSTLEPAGVPTIEIAFFGGSFTGIPLDEQRNYLKIAREYKDSGRIDKIHLSTRPDYISTPILNNLKEYGVDTIELGVQSFDDRVLALSNRGHDSAVVYEASELIKSYGFQLGIQLMIGLPGDSLESCLYSARETVAIGPSIARLYPTVVIKDTALYRQSCDGTYIPLSQEEAVYRTKEMYKILVDAGINIIRVGLKSSDIISDNGQISSGTFHPAFRQLVESELAKESILNQLEQLGVDSTSSGKMDFFSNGKSFSNLIGNNRTNKSFFAKKYPCLSIRYCVDESLDNLKYKINYKERDMNNTEKAVITVVGKDMVGILAKVSTSCANAQANVLDVTQSVLNGFFCMVMIIDITDATSKISEIEAQISEQVPNMVVHVMHEDIFNSMHRI